MKNFYLLVICLFSFAALSAQEEAIFQHYLVNPIVLNPAYAGFNNIHQVQLNARVSWTGFENAPKTYSAMYNGPIGNAFGVGVNVMSDQAAELINNRVQLNFGFRFNLQDNWKVATGFAAELRQARLSNEAMAAATIQGGDAILGDYANGRGSLDATLGIYTTYESQGGMTFAGLTFNNLVQNRLDGVAGSSDASVFQYYTFVLGHEFEIFDLDAKIEPSVAIRQIRNSTETVLMDFNLKGRFLDDQLITGLSYRTLGIMGILLGTKLEGLDIYYSYDLSFQDSQQYHSGAHEVTIGISFGGKDKLPGR
ncbi:MAG: PorP/SprF family type IX secretion system membrane protein [Saprospiraceae bacterium]|nr:PorP/SprF family type IX secretion system membrane protein [Lewinella sp.]